MQHAKRAYEVKHGLVGMRDPMHFFDDEPPVEDGDADEVDAGDDAGEGGEDAVDAEGGDDAAAVSAASSE